MSQYNTLNVKLSNSQLSKLKSWIKNGIEVSLNLSSNVVGDSNNETNFPHKPLLTDTQVSRLHKAFADDSSCKALISLLLIRLSQEESRNSVLIYILREMFWCYMYAR